MIWVDQWTQTGWCMLDTLRENPVPNITFLSSVYLWHETREASLLRLSASYNFFCSGLLHLFDGGVKHRPISSQLEPPCILPGYQGLLVLFPSAHSSAGYAATIRTELEDLLTVNKPRSEPRFNLQHIHLRRQNYDPIDPDYLYALTADMNNLLAHSMGVSLLQILPTWSWPMLRIDVDHNNLIYHIFEAVCISR